MPYWVTVFQFGPPVSATLCNRLWSSISFTSCRLETTLPLVGLQYSHGSDRTGSKSFVLNSTRLEYCWVPSYCGSREEGRRPLSHHTLMSEPCLSGDFRCTMPHQYRWPPHVHWEKSRRDTDEVPSTFSTLHSAGCPVPNVCGLIRGPPLLMIRRNESGRDTRHDGKRDGSPNN